MSVIVLLIAASGLVALVFLALFWGSVKQGQYDDTWSPSRRILVDDERVDDQGNALPEKDGAEPKKKT